MKGVFGDRLHDHAPFFVSVNFVNLLERFVHIGNSCDQGRALPNCAANCLPVEWVAPAVVVIPWTTSFDQNLEKMNRPLAVFLLSRSLCEQAEPHCVMCICDGKALRLPEQPPGGWNKRF